MRAKTGTTGPVAIGTDIDPVPVTGLAANFSPIPRIAPPPLGSTIDGAVIDDGRSVCSVGGGLRIMFDSIHVKVCPDGRLPLVGHRGVTRGGLLGYPHAYPTTSSTSSTSPACKFPPLWAGHFQAPLGRRVCGYDFNPQSGHILFAGMQAAKLGAGGKDHRVRSNGGRRGQRRRQNNVVISRIRTACQ